jgi:hypothetical protein
VHARIAQASASPRRTHRKPDLVAGSRSIHPLLHEFKTERQLELADHHDRRLVSTERDQITAADFALVALRDSASRGRKASSRSSRVALGLAGQTFGLPRLGKRPVSNWAYGPIARPTTSPVRPGHREEGPARDLGKCQLNTKFRW